MSTDNPASGNGTVDVPPDGLREALWTQEEWAYEEFNGPERTALAKGLRWDEFNFCLRDEISYNAIILEQSNNQTLSVLACDGTVYQLGDRIRFETTPTTRGWGTTSRDPRTVENQIDRLSERTASISRLPTYSNAPRDSPSAYFGETDITLVERSDIDDYRHRLQEGAEIDLPDTINGWALTEFETRTDDSSVLPTDLVTKFAYDNGEGTQVTAHWRGGYNVWRISTPIEGVLSEENIDEYLYEIDVPQQAVRTDTALEYVREALEAMDPRDFQAPYDLREDVPDDPSSDRRAGPAPVAIPDQVGDWIIEERNEYSITWENQNGQSAWAGFSVKLDMQGGVRVRNEDSDEVHDRRYIQKYFPSGDPRPGNIDCDYVWRRREMFDENWHYALSYLAQTSDTPVAENTLQTLNEQAPTKTGLKSFNHDLDMDPHSSMARENGTLLAY